MKMRWGVTFKDDDQLKARLVVQEFADRRIGKIPRSSPTASRRPRQSFPDTCCFTRFFELTKET